MSSDCIRLIVVAVTLLLSDVTCQTVHNISISHDVRSGRQRGQAEPLTQAVKSAAVDHHNALRALEGAANMEIMVWNEDVASRASSWALQCKEGHQEPRQDGQNIADGGNPKNLAPKINKWYNEKAHYTLETHTCRKWPCGHYTQVVWAHSRYVGCVVSRCPYNRRTTCNYSPEGNTNKGMTRPYRKGPACSKCPNGAGWCKNKLCNWQCTRAGEGCSCAAICYNCATLDLGTCRCKCAKGWRGVDCTVRCKDTHKWCGKSPGYPYKSFCDKEKLVKLRCPAFCGLCEADINATEGLCPPVRGPAADSAQTMFIKSHQSTMIFVIMLIIAFTIISYDAL